MPHVNDKAVGNAPNCCIATPEITMRALSDLFTSDVGLMSLAGIIFVLGMAAFFVRFFIRHMHEDEARASAAKR